MKFRDLARIMLFTSFAYLIIELFSAEKFVYGVMAVIGFTGFVMWILAVELDLDDRK